MLNLATTGTKLQLVTSAAGSIDVVPSWVDLSGTTVTAGGTPLAITTATTTDIVPAPGASTVRNVKSLAIRNKGAAANTVTVVVDVGGTDYEVVKKTLTAGNTLVYEEGIGWVCVEERAASRSVSTADQVLTSTAATAITGSTIDAASLKAGTVLKWVLTMSKGATGTVAQTFDLRFGTNGTTADTVRLGTYSTGTQTNVADAAEVEIRAVVRSVGAAGVLHGTFEMQHNLAATGFAPTANVILQSASAGFDMTVAGLKATLVHSGGTASSATIHACIAERIEP